MARIRSIKPELWQSPQVMNLSHSARLLFIGLITQADDHGKGSSDVRKLRAAVFPGDDIETEQLRKWLDEIRDHYLAVFYHAEGFGDLYLLPSWSEHQYVQKRQESRYPDPLNELLPERYRKATGTIPGDRKDRKDRKDQGSDARERVPVKAGTLRAAGDEAEAWLTGRA